MVWLKANSTLEQTYKKLINATRSDVDWNGEILVKNNVMILPGSLHSLVFDFDLKRVYADITDIPEISEDIYDIGDKKLLINILNMLLYIFGKWGAIQGIKVSHTYAKIDMLFKQILKEIDAEAYYTENGIKFVSNGLSVVFEDIIISSIYRIRFIEEMEKKGMSDENLEEGYSQGLWHDMKWKVTYTSFVKSKLDDKMAVSNRTGSNFYMIPYTCPDCSSHLHMSVYPNGKEFVIDTEEGRVYIARIYMCPVCSKFYTPRPGRLLAEGDVYILDFDEDEKAAQDYKKLVGNRGKKTSNSNFNMYEADYINNVHKGNKSLADICSHVEGLSEDELDKLLLKMDEGFYPEGEIERFLAIIEQELEYRQNMLREEQKNMDRADLGREAARERERSAAHDRLDAYTAYRKGLKSGKIGAEGIAGGYNKYRRDYSMYKDGYISEERGVSNEDNKSNEDVLIDEEDSNKGTDRLKELLKNYMDVENFEEVTQKDDIRANEEKGREEEGESIGQNEGVESKEEGKDVGQKKERDRKEGEANIGQKEDTGSKEEEDVGQKEDTGSKEEIETEKRGRRKGKILFKKKGKVANENKEDIKYAEDEAGIAGEIISVKNSGKEDKENKEIKTAFAKETVGKETEANTEVKKKTEASIEVKKETEVNAEVKKEIEVNIESKKELQVRQDEKKSNKEGSRESIIKKMSGCRDSKYSDIQKLINEVKNSQCSEDEKDDFLKQLYASLETSGKKELDYLISHLPQNDSRERYKRVRERIKSYSDIDTGRYEEIIDKFINNAERAELSSMVKKVKTGDRRSILEMFDKIAQYKDFDIGTVKEYTDELYKQVTEIDTETVRKICPDVSALDVEDGIRAMEEIEAADILPEIKSNMKELIHKKLTRMKTEECEQLVEKLKKNLTGRISDDSRIHFYDVRKMNSGDNNDAESLLIRKAISRYAFMLGKYEYPIMICDSSLFSNGKDGFIVTPDHIFYKGIFKSGSIDVMNINSIVLESGKAGKAIFATHNSDIKVKLPCALNGKDQENMAEAVNEFVEYLKAKPKSRSVAYLAQEKHAAICCYRCGHVFKAGSICPKCGSRN